MSLDKCVQLRIYYHSQDTEQLDYPKHYILFRISIDMFGMEFTLTFEVGAKPLGGK